MIEYKRIKEFSEQELERLFKSVDWFSGSFPDKLKTAFYNSGKVVSAWDGGELVGLIRGLDDGAWQAVIDCLLVNPKYQGQGIASQLLKILMDEYKDFLYVTIVPDEKKNVGFYEMHGFKIMEEGTPMQIVSSW